MSVPEIAIHVDQLFLEFALEHELPHGLNPSECAEVVAAFLEYMERNHPDLVVVPSVIRTWLSMGKK